MVTAKGPVVNDVGMLVEVVETEDAKCELLEVLYVRKYPAQLESIKTGLPQHRYPQLPQDAPSFLYTGLAILYHRWVSSLMKY